MGKRSENQMDWLVQPLWKPVWQFLEELDTELPYDPDIALPSIYPRDRRTDAHTKTRTQMFTAALLTMAPTEK